MKILHRADAAIHGVLACPVAQVVDLTDFFCHGVDPLQAFVRLPRLPPEPITSFGDDPACLLRGFGKLLTVELIVFLADAEVTIAAKDGDISAFDAFAGIW